jgi:hypothetical protein
MRTPVRVLLGPLGGNYLFERMLAHFTAEQTPMDVIPGDHPRKGISEPLVQELRHQAARGARVPDLLRLPHERLGREAAYERPEKKRTGPLNSRVLSSFFPAALGQGPGQVFPGRLCLAPGCGCSDGGMGTRLLRRNLRRPN